MVDALEVGWSVSDETQNGSSPHWQHIFIIHSQLL